MWLFGAFDVVRILLTGHCLLRDFKILQVEIFLFFVSFCRIGTFMFSFVRRAVRRKPYQRQKICSLFRECFQFYEKQCSWLLRNHKKDTFHLPDKVDRLVLRRKQGLFFILFLLHVNLGVHISETLVKKLSITK